MLATVRAFKVAPPSSLSDFFDSIDRQLFESVRLPPPTFPAIERVARPEGMAEDLFHRLSMFVDPPHRGNVARKISVDEQTLATGFDLTPIGDRLLTVGTEVRMVDVASGEVVQRWPGADDLVQGFIGIDDSIYLVDRKSIKKIATTDGAEIGVWTSERDIEMVATSMLRNVFCVLTADGRCIALDADLQVLKTFYSEKILGKALSVQHEGKWAIFMTSEGPVRWSLDDRALSVEYLTEQVYEPTKLSVAGGVQDCWIAEKIATSYEGQHAIVPLDRMQRGLKAGMQLGVSVKHARSCYSEAMGDWMLTISDRLDWNGNIQKVLLPLKPTTSFYGIPVILERSPTELQVSLDGRTVAIGFRTGIEIIDDYYLTEDSDSQVRQVLLRLADEGRHAEIETALAFIDEQRRVPWRNFSNEAVKEAMIRQLAVRLGCAMVDAPNSEFVSQTLDWCEQGSQVGRIVMASARIAKVDQLKSNGANNPYAPDLRDQVETEVALAKQELTALLEDPMPPFRVFWARITLAYLSGEAPETLLPVLRRALELYPGETAATRELAFQVFNQSRLEHQAFVTNVAELYPADQRDRIYAEVGAIDRQSLLDQDRLIRGIQQLARSHCLSGNLASLLSYDANKREDHEAVRLLAEQATFREHSLLPYQFYGRNILGAGYRSRKMWDEQYQRALAAQSDSH